MSNRHAFTRMDGEILFEKAALRMDALLAEYGASHSSKPPPAVELEMFRRAMVETAAVHFPGVDLEAVGYGFHACAHPAFLPAFERVRLSTADNSDVFAVARGVDAAIVLAGFGLPVAPYDLMTSRIIEKPSNDMNAVLTLFRRDQTAFVSYNVCAAPFYVLLTDCVRSLRQRVANDPRLSEVERLFARTGGSLLSDPEKNSCLKSSFSVGGREMRFSTVALLRPKRVAGSITLHAGWQVEGEPHGAPNDGYLPVPVQLLRAVVYDSEFAAWLSRPVAAATPVH